MSQTIRTRIAPSPTGDPHIGTAYIALYNKIFAAQHQGTFVLRIEDTDQSRSDEKCTKTIIDALKWLELDYDEGPGKEGNCGPYVQSQRKALYQEHIAQLLEKEHAFYCFCDKERLDTMRQQQKAAGATPKYDGHCMKLSKDQIKQKLAAHPPYVVRMKIPDEGSCCFHDTLRGDISINYQQIDAQILQKSDGMPTYHLANVVDDHLMEISDVIRGEEWLPSTPKHVLLYQYFGWEVPRFHHLPLMRNQDKSKLSKRKNPTSILWFKDAGFLPQALINYLGIFGLSQEDGDEKHHSDTLYQEASLEHIALSGPIFDLEKLRYLNSRYLREDFTPEALGKAYLQWAYQDENKLEKMMDLIQARVSHFGLFSQMLVCLSSESVNIAPETLANMKLAPDVARQALFLFSQSIEQEPNFDHDSIEAQLDAICSFLELKKRALLEPFFIAIFGQSSGLPLFDTMALIGKNLSRSRIRFALDTLGGVSKKEQKSWSKIKLAEKANG